MIEAVYISHTQYCSGWDIDNIIKGTVFKKACANTRFPKNEEAETIKMVDWDFKRAKKNYNKVWDLHLNLCKSYDFDVVFAPDSFVDSNPDDLINKVETLLDLQKRVVIPVHGWFEEYIGYELGLPTAGNFNPCPKNFWLWDIKEQITHILGGSPHSHIDYMGYCPNLITVDGNQCFTLATKAGKYWKSGKWLKPEYEMSNEDIFKLSIDNVDRSLRERVLPISRRL